MSKPTNNSSGGKLTDGDVLHPPILKLKLIGPLPLLLITGLKTNGLMELEEKLSSGKGAVALL